jgi:hypothetical protein
MTPRGGGGEGGQWSWPLSKLPYTQARPSYKHAIYSVKRSKSGSFSALLGLSASREPKTCIQTFFSGFPKVFYYCDQISPWLQNTIRLHVESDPCLLFASEQFFTLSESKFTLKKERQCRSFSQGKFIFLFFYLTSALAAFRRIFFVLFPQFLL